MGPTIDVASAARAIHYEEPTNMLGPDGCLKSAAHYGRQAKRAHDAAARQKLLEVAAKWRQMAESQHRSFGGHEGPDDVFGAIIP